MTRRRIKFIWGGARQIRGRWYAGLFGFYERIPGLRDSGLAVSVRGLLVWFSAALAGYLAGAAALHWVWKRNPYHTLTFADAVLYPVRREQITAKKGRAYVAQGLELWREQKFHDAANLLRHGLARWPFDLRARMTLADYYVLVNRRPLALEVLTAGLTAEFPGRAYLEKLFAVAEQMEDYEIVERTAARYRRLLDEEDELRDKRWLEARQFGAQFAAKRYEAALALARETGAADAGREREVLALLALGRAEEATRFLAAWQNRPGVNRELVTRLQVRAFREAKQFAEMDDAIAELRRISPAAASPVVYGIVQQALAGRKDAARELLEDYIFRFSGTPANLVLVAEPLAEMGEQGLLDAVAAAAAERGHPALPYEMMFVRVAVHRGDWDAAATRLERMVLPVRAQPDAGQIWRDWMLRLVEAARRPTDATQVQLLEFMRSRPWPMTLFRQTIETLRRAERWELVREVTALAQRVFPSNSWVQTQTLDLPAQPIASALQETVDRATDEKLRSEIEFFAVLDQLIQAGRWDEAADTIASAREASPPLDWLGRRDPDLRFAQARIGHGRDSTTEMLAAARLYLNGSNDRSNKMLELAREIYPMDKARAIELAKEVRRRSPDYPPVNRQLAAWQRKT